MIQHVHKVSIKDYRPPQFEVLNIRLNIDIRLGVTQVTQTSVWRRLGQETKALVLNGKNLKLLSLKVNGQPHEDVKVHENGLSIESLGAEFILEIVTEIYPEKNFSCEGLYYSGKTYLTQCEAEDFRRITYFLDRPDVLTFYEVRIEADRAKNPILLSNGHLVKEEDLGNGRHAAIWKDPFKKPCYLFAMVAGDMGCLEDQYETLTGRKILLKIYSPHGTQHLCHFAMESLKRSMRWDEETFGLEYDLDLYMIVVTDDFNGGAMENKGLNIFHTRYVFADQKIATDAAFIGVESVIAHEYFHNYSGNRVTCQNWFHLSLKEGLTVFRDQEFSADMWNRGVIRQTQVRGLIERQFAEDGGPN
ncbi:MAG TPA: M1 family aminopeptidase, partial [Pseudobdellovibrionaceae bacterium]|nr:M1 family aminopeptidase [Pseudobdellovibrionaceae bacterium]